MANCLVTKLKSTVENSSLVKLGCMNIERIYSSTSSAPSSLLLDTSNIPGGEEVTLTIIGEGNFIYAGQSTGKTFTLRKNYPTAIPNLTTSNGNYIIQIENKYAAAFYICNAEHSINMSDAYYTNTETINGVGWYGNVSSLDPDKITELVLGPQQVGKVNYSESDIAKLKNLIKLSLNSTSYPTISMSILGTLPHLEGSMNISCAEGSIEDFVIAQRASGRTSFSGTLDFFYLGNKVKVYNSDANYITQSLHNTITWTASDFTFNQSN